MATVENEAAVRLSPRERAENTNVAARAIIDAEVAARLSKTARLRELRLAQEAAAPPPPTPRRRATRKKK